VPGPDALLMTVYAAALKKLWAVGRNACEQRLHPFGRQ
jgi:hypothetical protein